MNRQRHPASIKDRTKEFRSAVDSFRRTSTPTPGQRPPATPAPPPYHPRNEFTKLAANIGRDIQGTARKLERLGTLAKRRTLFDDKPDEINTLTGSVKQDLAVINQKIAALQRHSANPTHNVSAGNPQAREHDANVVMFLQSKLADTSMNFKNILEVRSDNIRATQSRRQQFMDVPSREPDPAHLSKNGSPLYLTQRRTPQPDRVLEANESEDFVSLSVPDVSSSQQQLLVQEDYNQQYLDSRATAIQSIESTIAELGGIFQQLAQMVSEQRDVVQRIDANVEDIEMNVTGAQSELLKYYSYVSSNRWLMLKIFAIIIMFVTVFILVM
ncbi:Integral membrane protein SED5 [Dispira parvispora]|uniref:Integral membrane protein SED5 n=1 Tax=Dispira parvispora TaxID=1520584 RepID=A0A9W8B194_9FUNG|nr:Integral membrane protein SED5 [Dispira parvispora]